MSLSVVACTMDALGQVDGLKPGFSCWLHLEVPPSEQFEGDVIRLARLGCAAFLVTGPSSAEWHDRVDDALRSIQVTSVSTIWQDEREAQIAWDFLNLDFGGAVKDLRLVAASSYSRRAELEASRKILGLIDGAWDL